MGDQSERFTPYDSADYLTGVEDVAACLEAAIEEGGDRSGVHRSGAGDHRSLGQPERAGAPGRNEP